jgi:hypothetical protein
MFPELPELPALPEFPELTAAGELAQAVTMAVPPIASPILHVLRCSRISDYASLFRAGVRFWAASSPLSSLIGIA